MLKAYPTTVNHSERVDFANFDERLSAVDCLVVNTIGVSEGFIKFIPDNEPPLEAEIYCWIWAIRPDLSKEFIDNDMNRFWNYIS